jgi:hypothetical protein
LALEALAEFSIHFIFFIVKHRLSQTHRHLDDSRSRQYFWNSNLSYSGHLSSDPIFQVCAGDPIGAYLTVLAQNIDVFVLRSIAKTCNVAAVIGTLHLVPA